MARAARDRLRICRPGTFLNDVLPWRAKGKQPRVSRGHEKNGKASPAPEGLKRIAGGKRSAAPGAESNKEQAPVGAAEMVDLQTFLSPRWGSFLYHAVTGAAPAPRSRPRLFSFGPSGASQADWLVSYETGSLGLHILAGVVLRKSWGIFRRLLTRAAPFNPWVTEPRP